MITVFNFLNNYNKLLLDFAEYWLKGNREKSDLFPYSMEEQEFEEQFKIWLSLNGVKF